MTKQSRMTLSCTVAVVALAAIWLTIAMPGARAEEEEEETVSMSVTDVVEMIEPFGDGCDPKPEREHIVDMVLNKEDVKYETKCFRACLLKQFELMPEGEMKFNGDKTVEMMNMMFPDKEDDSRRIVDKCNEIMNGNTDRCEIAHGIAMCMLRDMREASFKIPEIKED
ncbi:Odorant-binding protein 19b [Drosophila willistoni]|uniref:Odorant-binding protein 19b n=2 Tax=Drosophila willistoni TaxID=7260 RepID=B4MTE7_DROWI|nr:Odorant-binding protein 19b [Drosophila willistoni]